jgi:4-amino-4-deoxy-L-arabinose transferase-like glycosyltransferase
MKPAHWLFIFLGLLTIGRLAIIGHVELETDEAYYFMWSERLDLSYFSKGPGVALAIKAGTALFGPTEFGIRFLSPLLALGTSLLLFFFTRRLYGGAIAVWTVLTVNLIPIFSVGGLLMTIDPLSIFFWTAALFAFWMALERAPAWSLYWPLTGLLIGCGFLCKYTNAMQLISILLVLGINTKLRREFRAPGLYTLLAGFLICTTPVIVWNARHEWITVAHLQARGGLDSAFAIRPLAFLEFLGAHFGVYSPLIFAALVIALWWARGWANRFKPRFLLMFSLPLLVLYFMLALKQAGEPNWTAPAFVSLGVLAVALWQEAAQQQVWARRFAIAALALGAYMSVTIVNTDMVRASFIPWPYRADPSTRLRGWRTTAEVVETARAAFESAQGAPAFMIANKYQTAAELAFYMQEKRIEGPAHPPVYIPESQGIENQFSFWRRYDEFLEAPPGTGPREDYYTEEQGYNPFIGRNALYVTDRDEERAPSTVKDGFERVEMIGLYEIRRRGLPLRNIRVFACYNYRSLPL